jgi:anti-sigma B factor antagonist
MNLITSPRQVGAVTVFDVSGHIVAGEECAAFREQVCNLLADGHRKVILNLADVHYIDSTGLAYLVSAVVSVRKLRGEMKLLGLSRQIHQLLKITKLHTILEIFEDESLAVESFSNSVAASTGT